MPAAGHTVRAVARLFAASSLEVCSPSIWICRSLLILGLVLEKGNSDMGTACLEQNAVVQIDGAEHRLLRKSTDTRWQLEDVGTGLFVAKEHSELLQM